MERGEQNKTQARLSFLSHLFATYLWQKLIKTALHHKSSNRKIILFFSQNRTSVKSIGRSFTASIPVRVTKPYARKQRNIAVSEFFFHTENRLCPLLVRYCDFVADILVLCCCILRKKAERSVHRLSHSRLCSLEHMSIDVQSRSRVAMA